LEREICWPVYLQGTVFIFITLVKYGQIVAGRYRPCAISLYTVQQVWPWRVSNLDYAGSQYTNIVPRAAVPGFNETINAGQLNRRSLRAAGETWTR
jgi:hypothetical protein